MSRVMVLQFLPLGIVVAQHPVRTALENEAHQIDLLAPLELGNYSGGVPRVFPRPEILGPASVSRLANSEYPAAELIPLLSDSSPRIRVLALELLFRKEDPRLLPVIVGRLADNERTFDRLEYYDYRANGPPSSRRASQTVSDFAKAMTNFYGVRGDFGEYWEARKGRKYWFSWLRSRLSLITGGLPTLNPGVREKLAPFKEMLNRLPSVDRDLYLIWLQCTFTEPALADDDELSQTVKRLGRESVLAIVEGNPPGGDPDLSPSWDDGQYWHNAGVVLQHATGILRREDASRIAAVVNRERENFKNRQLPETLISVSYTIAQASLLPGRASQLLHTEIDRLPGPYEAGSRGQLTAALLRLRGNQELTFVRNWFYGEPPTPAYGPQAQRALIASLGNRDGASVNILLDDARTNSLSPGLMAYIYEKFPGLRRKLLLDWFYAPRHDPHQMGNSIEYFLTIMLLRNRDHGLLKEILLDPRLDRLSESALFDLEQKIGGYRLPSSLRASFPDIAELHRCFPFDSPCPFSGKAVRELTQFLRAGAAYVDAQHGY